MTAPWASLGGSFTAAPNNGELVVGQFYLDLDPPARTGKRGGAWMDDVRTRWLRPDTGKRCKPRPSGLQLCPMAWMANLRC